MTEQFIKVHFRNLLKSDRRLTAELSPECTGQDAIDGLLNGDGQKAPFLDPLINGKNYRLSVMRTEKEIMANMTFAEAEVMSGDEILVGTDFTGA